VINFRSYATRELAAIGLATKITSRLQSEIEKHGVASLALPGGSTPTFLYQQLAKSSIDWESVCIINSDERCVDRDHARSNYHNMMSSLCDGLIPEASVRWLDCSIGDAQLADFFDKQIKRLSVCVLGMGDDGHIASLFPGSSVLETKPSGGLVHADASEGLESRITLSPSAILDAADVHLLIYGSAKKAVLDKAANNDDIMAMPVRLLLNQTQKDIEIHYAD